MVETVRQIPIDDSLRDRRNDMTDVVILGGGLAGLTLARHVLLETECRVLLLERRPEIPPPRQKVGESTVQLAGYYLAKVLDLEELLVEQHLMKYNLRFYWPTPGYSNRRLDHYSQDFIRPFSNIASYQLDRNLFESALLERNLEHDRFTYCTDVSSLEVQLGEDEQHHRVRYSVKGHPQREISTSWVVDTSGRGRHFGRRWPHQDKAPAFHHGSFFWWVEGRVDIERLDRRSRAERRLDPRRRTLGHLPQFLATNHFMGEGMWFWVIPLRGKTSLGLVYDRDLIDQKEVFSVEKATRFVCRRFPMFADDLPQRKVLDFGGIRDFALDCQRTISPQRWAVSGEAGRFTDPLYSPGSDLISVHNTLIVDAIKNTPNSNESTPAEREVFTSTCHRHERIMRALFAAYVPSYARTYDVLGDARAFAYKYVWELSVYFAFYVFPFINDLFTDRRFAVAFFRHFSALGTINTALHQLLHDYYQWRRTNLEDRTDAEPALFDLLQFPPLASAESTFYEVGVSIPEAKKILGDQLRNLEHLARLLYASIAAEVCDDPRALTASEFVARIDLAELRFAPRDWREQLASLSSSEQWQWPFEINFSALERRVDER